MLTECTHCATITLAHSQGDACDACQDGIMLPLKRCQKCAKHMPKKRHNSRSQHQLAKYCSPACYHAKLKPNRRAKIPLTDQFEESKIDNRLAQRFLFGG